MAFHAEPIECILVVVDFILIAFSCYLIGKAQVYHEWAASLRRKSDFLKNLGTKNAK